MQKKKKKKKKKNKWETLESSWTETGKSGAILSAAALSFCPIRSTKGRSIGQFSLLGAVDQKSHNAPNDDSDNLKPPNTQSLATLHQYYILIYMFNVGLKILYLTLYMHFKLILPHRLIFLSLRQIHLLFFILSG